MDRVIYTALTGLTARQRAQAVTANNLANAETPGFRREIIAAEGRYLRGPGEIGAAAIARAQTGSPSLTTPQEAGTLRPTGRDLDITLLDNAWLAIAAPPQNGQPREAYTRRGDIQVSPAGQLVLGDGRIPLDVNGAPVQVPANARLKIGSDGTLTALVEGEEQAVARLKLVAGGTRETGFDKNPDGQFTTPAPLPQDPTARLATGALEASNVSAAQGLIELVEQSRAFDASARLMRTARELDEAGARLLRLE